jgi:hypothetical protein
MRYNMNLCYIDLKLISSYISYGKLLPIGEFTIENVKKSGLMVFNCQNSKIFILEIDFYDSFQIGSRRLNTTDA